MRLIYLMFALLLLLDSPGWAEPNSIPPALQHAADSGDAKAQRELGSLYFNNKDKAQAVKWWQKAALANNADAQLLLGTAYHDGLGGLSKDDKAAVKWWRKAADAGNAAAAFNLAGAYHDGMGGLKASDKESVKWYRKAAEQQDVGAMYNLAIAYYHGMGVAKNLNQAVTWFRKAAEAGDPQSQYILAAAYQNGMGGVPKDNSTAYMWLTISMSLGNKEAEDARHSMARLMKPQEIQEGESLAAIWKQKHRVLPAE